MTLRPELSNEFKYIELDYRHKQGLLKQLKKRINNINNFIRNNYKDGYDKDSCNDEYNDEYDRYDANDEYNDKDNDNTIQKGGALSQEFINFINNNFQVLL
jgi:uncharacterized protein (UPF0305 family)